MPTNEFRDAGMMQLVTHITASIDGQWVRATPVGQIDELLTDTSMFAYFIDTSGGAVLESSSLGIRMSAAGVELGVGGGGPDKLKLDIDTLPATSPQATDIVAISRGGTHFQADVSDLATSSDLTSAPTSTTVVIDNTGGADATILAATSAAGTNLAGVLLPTEKDQLLGITDDWVKENMIAANAVTTNEIAADAVTTTEIATNAVTSTEINADSVTSSELAPNAVLTVNVADAQITLAKLAPDAIVDLGQTADPTTVTVTNSLGGSDAVLELADGTNAGLLSPAGYDRVEGITGSREVWVTDFGADPTGVADSAAAIQAAVDHCNGTVKITKLMFTPGTYLVSTAINLPTSKDTAQNWFEIDGQGSRITATGGASVFSRTVTSVLPGTNNVSLFDWVPVIRNFSFEADTPGQGTAILIQYALNASIDNCYFKSFNEAVKLVFCLYALVDNCDARECETSYLAMGGQGEIADGNETNSASNMTIFRACRVQSISGTGTGFHISASGNVRLENPTVEGSLIGTCFSIAGQQGGNYANMTDVIVEGAWVEFTTTIGAVFRLDIRESTFTASRFHSRNPPVDTLFVDATGSRECQIHFTNSESWNRPNALSSTAPWFNADQQAVGLRNAWYFTQQTMPSTDLFSDPSRWTGGIVPTIVESGYHDDTSVLFDNRVPAGGGSRKDSVDDLPDHDAAGILAIDFDAGTYDNKRVTLNADVTDLVLVSTRPGSFEIWFKQGVLGEFTASWGIASNDPPSEFKIDKTAGTTTVLRMTWDGTDWHWG